MNIKKFFSLLFFLISLSFYAQNFKIPSQSAWIMDSANIISENTKTELESYLKNLDAETGAQIAVFTINSLEDAGKESTTIEEYSAAVFEKWRLGQEGNDNGILLLVSVEDRKLRIEVGYGLENILTDAKCGIIIRKFITPFFKSGGYSEGIKNGVEAIAGCILENEEIISEIENQEKSKKSGRSEFLIPILMFAVFFGIVFASEFSARKKGKRKNSNSKIHSCHSSDDSNSSGRFSSSGNDSDFSGGGGGHSGGGGASGSW